MKKVIFVKKITEKKEMGKTEYINLVCRENNYEEIVPPYMCI